MANVAAKLDKNPEVASRFNNLLTIINNSGARGSHELLFEIAKALGFKGGSRSRSNYIHFGNGISIRIANHFATVRNFLLHSHPHNNFGIVIKLSKNAFKDNPAVDYLEFAFYPDKIETPERQRQIIEGFRDAFSEGDISLFPIADAYHGSGQYKDLARQLNERILSIDHTSARSRSVPEQSSGLSPRIPRRRPGRVARPPWRHRRQVYLSRYSKPVRLKLRRMGISENAVANIPDKSNPTNLLNLLLDCPPQK